MVAHKVSRLYTVAMLSEAWKYLSVANISYGNEHEQITGKREV